MQFLIGFGLAAIISYGAYCARSLDRSGALAATLLGTVVFGAGGWPWAVLLLAFFISSSLLTHAFQHRKRLQADNYAKGGPRDAGQVLGNGGLAALFAGLNHFYTHNLWVWIGFAAALAAVNADTWATELGVLSPVRPRLITNFMPVEKGTSGGVSLWGTLAAFFGALLIGALAVFLLPGLGSYHLSLRESRPIFSLIADHWSMGALITAAGLLGSLLDSLLGATVQAIYWCPTCQKETERHPLHGCGTPTTLRRGWRWLGNDWVNFFCGLSAAAVAVLWQVA